MSNTNNGGPAFPRTEFEYKEFQSGWPYDPSTYSGMTLRDYFASAALTGMLLAKNHDALSTHVDTAARASYAMADAMLKARES